MPSPQGGRNGNTAGSSFMRFWNHSYAPDYVGLVGLITAYILLLLFAEPFHRLFSLSDLNIAYPHAEHEHVSVLMNFVYALFTPIAFLLLFNICTGSSSHKHHATFLGFFMCLALTSFLTDVVKNTVGRPRPDLLARCIPRAGTPRDVLVGIEVCTQTDHHKLHDGWRSFPSGHSSFSFAGLGYTALFLTGQLRLLRDRRDMGRALVCLTPLLGAALIAISRCEDYRHDVFDVCTGAILGSTVTLFTYRRFWPQLSSRACHEPHPSPSTGTEDYDDEGGNSRGWSRARDEEEGGPMLSRSGAYEFIDMPPSPGRRPPDGV